jgi:hypothetical protein
MGSESAQYWVKAIVDANKFYRLPESINPMVTTVIFCSRSDQLLDYR